MIGLYRRLRGWWIGRPYCGTCATCGEPIYTLATSWRLNGRPIHRECVTPKLLEQY